MKMLTESPTNILMTKKKKSVVSEIILGFFTEIL